MIDNLPKGGDEVELKEEKPIETGTLDIPTNLLTGYDADDEVWSWGLSPRVMPLTKKRMSSSHSLGTRKVTSRERSSLKLAGEDIEEEQNLLLEPDMFLQVVAVTDPDGQVVVRPKTPVERQLAEPVKPVQMKPDETFITDPGTFFADAAKFGSSVEGGVPRAVVVKRDVPAPPSAKRPQTFAKLNHNKTLVLRADNEQKAPPKLALVKQLDNTKTPNFSTRKPKEKIVISEPKKFKSCPFVKPDLSSKECKNLLKLPADKGSKLAALQKRLQYDARKYAKCKVKTGSSSSESSEEEEEEEEDEEEDDSSDMEASPPKPNKVIKKANKHATKAEQQWKHSASIAVIIQRPISVLEEKLSEADRSILANLEAEQDVSSGFPTPAALTVRSGVSGHESPAEQELGLQDEGSDSSEVSVTAEDIEMFDRWVGDDTPTFSKESESDRAASIEIQQVMGIDAPVRDTPTSRTKHESICISEGGIPFSVISETESTTIYGHVTDSGVEKKEEAGVTPPTVRSEGEEEILEDAGEIASPSPDISLKHVTSVLLGEQDKTVIKEEDRVELVTDHDKASLISALNYVEPRYEDVLNVTGKTIVSDTKCGGEKDRDVTMSQIPAPDVTLLTTWVPENREPSRHFSVHHFCTLAVQPQLPRVLHNITRDSHTKPLSDLQAQIKDKAVLDWFEEHESEGEEPGSVVPESRDIQIEGCKVPELTHDKKLYWTPAPPKMDLPPLFVKSHLFPNYESAIATAEQQALLEQEHGSESTTSDEDTESPSTDEEDRRIRNRILERRHNSATNLNKPRQDLLRKLGPDQIQERAIRIRRPGSAPILSESDDHVRFKSDYYTSYGEIDTYHRNMEQVRSISEKSRPVSTAELMKTAGARYTQLVAPYLNMPISNRGVMSLSPSYTKLLPIGRASPSTKLKVSKQQLTEVKEALVRKRGLRRSTSVPCVFQETELRTRAGSFNDISKIAPQWGDSFHETYTGLKKCNLPVFAHKLGTLLSKEIVQLHQIIKKEQPDLYSDALNEIHRLTLEIGKGGDYLYYNKSRRGALYVKIGMFKDAKTDLDAVIEAWPKLADAYWHRHLISVVQGDYNTALNDLTNIIRHSQKQPRVYLARAEIYRKQGDITGAILNYSQALKFDKDNAETYYKRAQLFEEKGDILLALEDYTIANKLCPSNTIAILKKGKYNFERGAYSVAVADFTAMLEQKPYNSTARTYRGRAYAKMGKYTSALEDLSCAIHLDPTLHLPFYHRAVLLRKENPRRALQDFSVSILLKPTVENYASLLHRGILYTELQRYEEAVPDFEAVIDLDAGNVEAQINLGLICMLHLKQYKRAIRCFSGAIEVDPTNHRAYVCRGDAYKAIKQHPKALIDYTRAIHIKPNISRYYIYRGKLLLELGQFDQASKHIKYAAVLNTDNVGTGAAALQKAVVQSFLQHYEDAIFVLDRAAGLDPSPSQYILLGKTYLKAKKYREAIENFMKALMYLRRCRSIPAGDDMESDLNALEKNPKILKQEMPKPAAEVYYLIAKCHYYILIGVGKCHVESGESKKALEALNNAIRVNPGYAEAYYLRGLVRITVKSQRPLLDFNRALAYNPNYFQAYLTRAAYFGMKGRYSKAMFNCNEALRIQPKSVRAYLYRGALKFEIKNYELGVDDLSSAIELDPLCSLAYYNRAVCYQNLKRHKEALRDYGVVLLLDKERNQRVLLNRGLLYYQAGDYDNALVDFKLAVKDSPDNALLYHTLGLCYHRNNQIKDALECLTHSMQLKEHFLQAYISRGNVYMNLNTEEGYRRSKHDYCRALHYDPTNLTAHTNLGITLQSYGKMNEAWKQFTSAIKIDPNCHSALEARSIVNLQMGHLFGAFCDINTAVKLHPTSIMLTNRGVIQQYMKDPANAMADFQQAIAADPKYSLAYFNAANLYFNMRQFEKALRFYDAAVENCTDDESAVLNRAIAKVLLKDYDGALRDFDTAIKLNPFAAHAYYNRGNLHLTMGNNTLAETDYRKTLTLQPNDSSSYNQLAVALGRQFRKAEALDNYKLAIKLQGH